MLRFQIGLCLCPNDAFILCLANSDKSEAKEKAKKRCVRNTMRPKLNELSLVDPPAYLLTSTQSVSYAHTVYVIETLKWIQTSENHFRNKIARRFLQFFNFFYIFTMFETNTIHGIITNLL